MFGLGELGGAFSQTNQTGTAEIDLTVDLTRLSVRHDLMVGFYDPTTEGGGFSGLTLDLYADGTDVLHQSFTSVTAADAYFTDHAVDLDSLSTGALSGAPLTLLAIVTMAAVSDNNGYGLNLLLGEAPATTSGAVRGFAQAMLAQEA